MKATHDQIFDCDFAEPDSVDTIAFKYFRTSNDETAVRLEIAGSPDGPWHEVRLGVQAKSIEAVYLDGKPATRVLP